MPPTFSVTNHVYILRHGCGTKHTALQIDGYESVEGSRVYSLRFLSLD